VDDNVHNVVFTTPLVQLKAFRRGFLNVCGGQILELFQPKELMEMVIGNENYDFTEFQTKAHYGEPFHKDHETIKWFWEIFQMFTEDQVRIEKISLIA
jgi:hypothetical protein